MPALESVGRRHRRTPNPLPALELLQSDMRAGFEGIYQRCDRLLKTMQEARTILDRIGRSMIEDRRKTREWFESLKD